MGAGSLSLVGALVLVACATAASGPDDRTARVDVTPGDTYAVEAVAASDRAAEGSYTLVVERVGAAGRSRSQQGGRFALAAGEERALSTSRVNASPGDSIRVDLTVTWADGAITSDRARIGVPSDPRR